MAWFLLLLWNRDVIVIRNHRVTRIRGQNSNHSRNRECTWYKIIHAKKNRNRTWYLPSFNFYHNHNLTFATIYIFTLKWNVYYKSYYFIFTNNMFINIFSDEMFFNNFFLIPFNMVYRIICVFYKLLSIKGLV